NELIIYTEKAGGTTLNSRKLVSMFFKTLFIGGLAGFVASFFVNWQDYSAYLSPFDGFNLLGVALFYLGYALVFTVIAQTGSFAYLFIHRFGQGFFKTFSPLVQRLLMLFALFDMIFFTSYDISALFLLSLVIIIVMFAYIVSTIKVEQLKYSSFIPAMFLMIVVSSLELSLVLRAGVVKFMILMLVPVLVGNAY